MFPSNIEAVETWLDERAILRALSHTRLDRGSSSRVERMTVGHFRRIASTAANATSLGKLGTNWNQKHRTGTKITVKSQERFRYCSRSNKSRPSPAPIAPRTPSPSRPDPYWGYTTPSSRQRG